jgi:SAM-dependent methyltransferase
MADILQTPAWQTYYDRRFAEGYAEAWPRERYTRIASLLRELPLPERGTALDFGCGNGSFTRLLAETLPEWEVVGADVSEVALANASRTSPSASFVTVDSLPSVLSRFDLVFSHHVLEHVPSLPSTLRLFQVISRRSAFMLHVLPCGNAGSVEHRLSALRVDGVDHSREGRFFCDDEPHVRRLTSAQLAAAVSGVGFDLERQYYSQHFWSQLWPYAQKPVSELWKLTDWRTAAGRGAALRLLAFRTLFVVSSLTCLPTLYRWRLKPRHERRLVDHFHHGVALICAPFSTPASRFLRYMDERERRLRRTDRSGAEMYLVFQRRDPFPNAVDADARTVAEIIEELRTGKPSNVAERSGRAQDKDDGGGLETLRRDGYM